MIISIFQMRHGDSQSLDKLLKITSLVNDGDSTQVQASFLQSVKVLSLTKHCMSSPSTLTCPRYVLPSRLAPLTLLHSTHLVLTSV